MRCPIAERDGDWGVLTWEEKKFYIPIRYPLPSPTRKPISWISMSLRARRAPRIRKPSGVVWSMWKTPPNLSPAITMRVPSGVVELPLNRCRLCDQWRESSVHCIRQIVLQAHHLWSSIGWVKSIPKGTMRMHLLTIHPTFYLYQFFIIVTNYRPIYCDIW